LLRGSAPAPHTHSLGIFLFPPFPLVRLTSCGNPKRGHTLGVSSNGPFHFLPPFSPVPQVRFEIREGPGSCVPSWPRFFFPFRDHCPLSRLPDIFVHFLLQQIDPPFFTVLSFFCFFFAPRVRGVLSCPVPRFVQVFTPEAFVFTTRRGIGLSRVLCKAPPPFVPPGFFLSLFVLSLAGMSPFFRKTGLRVPLRGGRGVFQIALALLVFVSFSFFSILSKVFSPIFRHGNASSPIFSSLTPNHRQRQTLFSVLLPRVFKHLFSPGLWFQ